MEVPVSLVNPALERKLAEERDRLKIPTVPPSKLTQLLSSTIPDQSSNDCVIDRLRHRHGRPLLIVTGIAFLLTAAANLSKFNVIVAIVSHAFFNHSSAMTEALVQDLPSRVLFGKLKRETNPIPAVGQSAAAPGN